MYPLNIRLLQSEPEITPIDPVPDILSTTYDYLVLYCGITISFLSFMGALFIMVTYLKFSKLRSYTYKLVTFISLSDFLFYFGKLLTIVQLLGVSNPIICNLQGILINYGELASVLWSAVIAFSLYSTIIQAKAEFQSNYDLKFKLFAFGIPVLATIIPWYAGLIGREGDTCWIIIDSRHRWRSFTFRIAGFYLPLWAVIAYNTYVYFKLIHYLNSINANVDLKRFTLFPLILVVCWFFPTLHRIESFFRDDSKMLIVLHNIFESMQGILNAVLYGMNENVRYEWKKFLILNNWCLCFFPDAQTFKNNIDYLEFEHQDSFLGSGSDYSSMEKKRSSQEIEMGVTQKHK